MNHQPPAPGGQPPERPWMPPPPGYSPPPRYAPPPSPAQAGAPGAVTYMPYEQRRALLAQQLQQAAARGLRVESQTEAQAVLVEGRPVNHTVHAIVTIFTCLAWGIVWAVLAGTGGETRHQVIVDEFGNVHWQNLGRV
jgi:hypothetical protein